MAKKVKQIGTGYIPRPWQARTHILLKRHNVLVFHRRGGKTVFAVNELVDQAIRFNKVDPKTGKHFRNPQFAFVATTVGQVEKIAWQYFKEYCANIPQVKFNESKLRITFPHPHGTATIFLFGAENFDTMRGIYLDGYVLDEYADMHPDVRDKVLLPTLSDRKGWEIIIGTPKGENAFKEIYDIAVGDPEQWFSCLHRASETGILDADELKMLKKTMSDEAYRQEYECDFNAAPSGKYFQKYIDEARHEGRITNVPYDPMVPVTTFWDLGHNDSTSIWFVQEVGRELHVIRYIENHGRGLEWYIEELNRYPYIYNEHVLPHDALHHELSTGTTRVDYLRNHGLTNIRVLPKTINKNEDIHAVRVILPKCYFDSKNCELGIKALAAYERKWDAKNQVYMDKPLHNWASHGADSFMYFAVGYEVGMSQTFAERYENLPRQGYSDYDILTDF